MAFCETCGKEFKTEQGLAGHQQLKHARQRSAERWDEGSVSAGQHSAERSLSAMPTAGERLERIESALDQLLGMMVERLDDQLAPAAEHAHESSCHECHQFALEVYNQGRVDGIKECHEHYKAIPLVPELRERWIAAQELVADTPLIKITRAEGPAADDGLIRIVSTPEGELARAEIGAIISQNEMTRAEAERKLGKNINRNRNKNSG